MFIYGLDWLASILGEPYLHPKQLRQVTNAQPAPAEPVHHERRAGSVAAHAGAKRPHHLRHKEWF
jgi:hypothetical protein